MNRYRSDSQLFNGIHQGETKALDVVIENYYNMVLYHCRRILKNEADAEEVTSDAFMVIYTKRLLFKTHGHLKKYLFKVATTGCLKLLEKRLRERAANQHYSDSIPINTDDVDLAITHSETMDRIIYEINQLSPRRRSVFMLFYFSDLSNDEIASELQITPSTVRTHLEKATKQLVTKIPKSLFTSLLIYLLFSEN